MKRKIICLTPVRNEAWILERFLRCASLWADHIVIADQMSTDGSREIAARFPKVVVVDNTDKEFNEPHMRGLLVDTARTIAANSILVMLDADEFLSSNYRETREFQTVLEGNLGACFRLDCWNLTPDLRRGWPDGHKWFIWIDDGRPYSCGAIHTPRLTASPDACNVVLNEIKALHYQYVDWARMKSKQRWYQCWELLHLANRRPLDIYRRYHHMDSKPASATAFPAEWLKGYQDCGIDMTSVTIDTAYSWDRTVLEYFKEFGTVRFRKLNIWDAAWDDLHEHHFGQRSERSLEDPRSNLERRVHAWLSRTQCQPRFGRGIRLGEWILRRLGW